MTLGDVREHRSVSQCILNSSLGISPPLQKKVTADWRDHQMTLERDEDKVWGPKFFQSSVCIRVWVPIHLCVQLCEGLVGAYA